MTATFEDRYPPRVPADAFETALYSNEIHRQIRTWRIEGRLEVYEPSAPDGKFRLMLDKPGFDIADLASATLGEAWLSDRGPTPVTLCWRLGWQENIAYPPVLNWSYPDPTYAGASLAAPYQP